MTRKNKIQAEGRKERERGRERERERDGEINIDGKHREGIGNE